MQKGLIRVAFGIVVSLGFAAMAAADDIEVGLKSFKFEVAEDAVDLFGYNEDEGKLFYYTNGKAVATIKVPAEGEYEFAITASGDPAEKERAKFKVAIGEKAVGEETTLTADEAKVYKFTAKLAAGEQKLSVAYLNDVYKEGEYDRNFYLHKVVLKSK